MNIIYKKIIALSLAIMSVTAFAGCDNNDSSDQQETTAVQSTVAPTTVDPAYLEKTADLEALHSYDEDGDELAGAWQITGGTGDQFGSFIYTFDGNGRAMLALGNMGYLADYTIDENEKTIEVKLVFGLNGKYNYKLSDDKGTITLTNTEDKSTTTIEKLEGFSMTPKPEENPKIDENILGAWLSENGEYLYFGDDGIMYQNLYGMNIIYSTYNAVDGVITSKYSMQDEELTDTYKYSVNDKVLTVNDMIYNKIPTSELV